MKDCRNCSRRNGSLCMLSGCQWITERLYPTKCGLNFGGWRSLETKVKPTIKEWLISFLPFKLNAHNPSTDKSNS